MKNQSFITVLVLVSMMLVGFVLGVRLNNLPTTNFLSTAGNPSGKITAQELKKSLKSKNFTLINVHTPYTGEIEKTDLFVPFDQIIANSDNLPKDKTTPIVLYCETGRMSGEALESFKKLGYTDVRHLAGGMEAWKKQGGKIINLSRLENDVLPDKGVELPLSWADLGPRLTALGVIDEVKFKKTVSLTPEQEQILTKGGDMKIRIDRTNVQFVVDMLWALGLAQKSLVYDEGPMRTQYKKEAASFASTGGWDQGKGNAMLYYNKFDLLSLTPDQQKQVAEISKNIYRPCCGNSTYFPDCNHGMAALAMIELMISKGIDESTIYQKILAFNAFWFPDTYLTTATYFARQGISWDKVDAKRVMGAEFSSGKGAADIAQKVGQLPWRKQSGGSCGA